MIDELGAAYEEAFAYLDAVIAATSAIAQARSLLKPYTRERP